MRTTEKTKRNPKREITTLENNWFPKPDSTYFINYTFVLELGYARIMSTRERDEIHVNLSSRITRIENRSNKADGSIWYKKTHWGNRERERKKESPVRLAHGTREYFQRSSARPYPAVSPRPNDWTEASQSPGKGRCPIGFPISKWARRRCRRAPRDWSTTTDTRARRRPRTRARP